MVICSIKKSNYSGIDLNSLARLAKLPINKSLY